MTNTNRYNLALSFWTASLQFLTLVENAAHETVAHENTWVMIRDFREGPITEVEYERETRWSDHTIIIPLLFNLLHGIELLIKGFLIAKSSETTGHDVVQLCEKFNRHFPKQDVLRGFFRKYTSQDEMPDILRQFLTDNQIQISSLYQSLRYPNPRNSQIMLTYTALEYRGREGIHVFSDLESEIEDVRASAVHLGRSLEP